jgi:hypothetical protein
MQKMCVVKLGKGKKMTVQQTQTGAELLAKRLDELDASLTGMESQEYIDDDRYGATEDEFIDVLLKLWELDGTSGEPMNIFN